jgi:hypothetical protein
MRILVVGSKNWINYEEVMRNITVAIEDVTFKNPEDNKIVFVHTGSAGAENMVTEYVGKVERYMRQKGFSVKEELVRSKYSGNATDKVTSDYDMISSGIDYALVFIRSSCKRSEYCIRLLKEMDVPTKVIRQS